MKNKQLRINANNHPANLFSCIRFMSQGFKQPSKKEINSLLLKLGDFEKWRYPRNIQKLYDYVGGEKEARKLVKKLGIKQNIFDYKEVRKLKAK